MTQMFNPPHPGKVLREYLGDMDVTTAARRLRVSRTTLSRILNGAAGISADMSLRLSDALGTHPSFLVRHASRIRYGSGIPQTAAQDCAL